MPVHFLLHQLGEKSVTYIFVVIRIAGRRWRQGYSCKKYIFIAISITSREFGMAVKMAKKFFAVYDLSYGNVNAD